jgi:hypothetical protein
MFDQVKAAFTSGNIASHDITMKAKKKIKKNKDQRESSALAAWYY